MNGAKFTELLQMFELPGSEKLFPSDYDWIFLQNGNEDLSKFWQSIYENYNKSDLLTDQELEYYEDLVEKGLTLPPEQLKRLGSHFGGLSIGSDKPWNAHSADNETEEEKMKDQDEIKLLQKRKDVVMLQKMEVRDRLELRKENVRRLEIDLEIENRKLQPALNELSKIKGELFTLIQETVKTYEDFSNAKDNPTFLSQYSLTQWQEEEEKFQAALKKYIDRQFSEDLQEFAHSENNSDVFEDDSLRGSKQAKFVKDANELNRITKMLEQAAVEDALADIKKHRKEAELEETSKVLEMVNENGFPTSSSILAEQIKDCEELMEAHTQDLSHQIECVKEKAAIIAQTERTNALLSNYKAKIQRQEYFLSKQKEVIEEFASQLARYDAFKIIFDIEKDRISENFELFLKLATYLCNDEQKLLQGENALERIFREWKDNDAQSSGELSLLKSLASPNEISIDDPENEYFSLQESQMISVQNLLELCSVMKASLFRRDRLPSRLPSSWLSSDLTEKQIKLEQDSWDFQQEMLAVFKDIQFKKQKKSMLPH